MCKTVFRLLSSLRQVKEAIEPTWPWAANLLSRVLPPEPKIVRPECETVCEDWVNVEGTGGRPGWVIFVVSWIVRDDRCYIHPEPSSSDSNGIWYGRLGVKVPAMERRIYALAVRPNRATTVLELGNIPVKDIPALERALESTKVVYGLSKPKRLIYKPGKSPC
jgi:hypothetical protein